MFVFDRLRRMFKRPFRFNSWHWQAFQASCFSFSSICWNFSSALCASMASNFCKLSRSDELSSVNILTIPFKAAITLSILTVRLLFELPFWQFKILRQFLGVGNNSWNGFNRANFFETVYADMFFCDIESKIRENECQNCFNNFDSICTQLKMLHWRITNRFKNLLYPPAEFTALTPLCSV